jgi:hypothetical protein
LEIRREPVTGECVWTGATMKGRTDWIFHLTPQMIAEIESGIAAVDARGLSMPEIRREDFSMPAFDAVVGQLRDVVENGRGFVMLRGLPVERYSVEQCEKIFWAMGTHTGSAVSQNARGELLSHVRDKGLAFGAKEVRGYETKSKLFYHNDNGDIVGLMCIHPAKSGGESRIVSTAAVYNAVLDRHPEYIDELCSGYIYHMRGEHPRGHPEVTEHRVPLFSWHAGRLSSRYTRNSILIGEKFVGNELDGRGRAPLDLVDALCEELCFEMDFRPGDMQLVSNHSVLHSRNEFEDFEEEEKKRDLLRLWLNIPGSRPLTYEFATRYGPGSARIGVPPVAR